MTINTRSNREGLKMNAPEEKSNIHFLKRNMDEQHLKNVDDSINYIKDVRKEFSNEVTDFAMEQTIACIKQFGALSDGGRCKTQDFILLENAIQAIIYRYYNLEHPLHPITDDMFVIEDEESEDEELPEEKDDQ
jgi:hypothetical protein